MNIMLIGYGRMNKMIGEIAQNAGDTVSGIVDFDYSASPFEIEAPTDAVIDFSHPDNLSKTLAYAKEKGVPAVIGTTNLTDAQKKEIEVTASFAPVLYAANYSLGVCVMKRACKMLYDALGEDFDVEIVEAHHNKKADAPSGTAKALADAMDPEGSHERLYGREGAVGARGREIGIHAVRGGTVAGEHRVLFLGEDETLEIRHEAISRRIFAKGAYRAAKWLQNKTNGLYTMENVLWEE